MPRTRGQEVALQERGLPTTPPQQLPTPRREKKTRAGNRKAQKAIVIPSDNSPPPQISSRITRTRNTSASQAETQVSASVRKVVKKPVRQAKSRSKKGAQSTDEEVISEEASEPKVLQELPENSTVKTSQSAKSLSKNETSLTPRQEHQALRAAGDKVKAAQTPPIVSRFLKRKLDHNEQGNHASSASKRQRTNIRKTKRVPQLFDEHGMLTLTAYKEVSISDGSSSEEETLETEGQPPQTTSEQSGRQVERSPATPQSRGWALSGLLPSAQTVSRFLPSFTRRTPGATPVANPRPSSATEISQAENSSSPAEDNEPTSALGPGHDTSDRSKEKDPNGSRRTSRRHRHPKAKRALKAKKENDEILKRDEMIASLRAQLEAQNAGQIEKGNEQAENAAQAEKAGLDKTKVAPEDFQAESETMATPYFGNPTSADNDTAPTPKSILKRKTLSPKEKSNPSGGGFSLVLDYSDSDDDTASINASIAGASASPSGPPSKKIRLSVENDDLFDGDSSRSTPYSGKELALSTLGTNKSRNTFSGSDYDTERPTLTDTPSNGPTVTIRVPSPSDSDSEWDGTSYVDESDDTVRHSSVEPALDHSGGDARASGPKATATSRAYENPNINPSFNFSGSLSKPKSSSELAFPTTWTFTDSSVSQAPSMIESPNLALDKARQSALKHKPQQPSRLREIARFSTSTVGSEAVDDEADDRIIESYKSDTEKGKSALHATERDPNKQFSRPSSIPKGNAFQDAQRPQEPEAQDPYAGRVMRQSPRDPMLLEPVPLAQESSPPIEHDPELSGEVSTESITSEEDVSDNLPVFDGCGKAKSPLAPIVKGYFDSQWGSDEHYRETGTALILKLRTNACADIAEQFEEYLTSHKDESKQFGAFGGSKVQISEIDKFSKDISGEMGNKWNTNDDGVALQSFDAEFAGFLNQPI